MADVSAPFLVGAARADITSVEPGTEMMGWAIPENRVQDVAMNLLARAFVVVDAVTQQATVIAVLELAYVAQHVRDCILEALETRFPEIPVTAERLLLCGTHTHSGPGGYSHHLLYTLTTPGFRPNTHRTIVEGTVSAIVRAWQNVRPGRIRFADRDLPISEPVSWNRSIAAYNRNPDVKRVDHGTRHHAVDRGMPLLLLEAADGTPIGAINWFAVHCTSIHSNNRWVHADNKGFAARFLEQDVATTLDAPGFVAAFAQGAAGDVTPNFRYDPHRKMVVGPYDDDVASAAHNGTLQADHARRVLELARAADPQPRVVDGDLIWLDFLTTTVDPAFADGVAGRRTGGPRLAVTFMEGTDEGPGPLLPLRRLNRRLSQWMGARRQRLAAAGDESARQMYETYGNMVTFLDAGAGRDGLAFGRFVQGDPVLPAWFDPAVAAVQELRDANAMPAGSWAPTTVPVQVVRIGSVAIAAIPFEPTTVAGRRMRQQLRTQLADQGVTDVVICSYANTYAGYLTTPQEHAEQAYEGASTYYGRWTLPAYQSRLAALAKRLAVAPDERPVDPVPRAALADPEDLARRSRTDVMRVRSFR